jgi:PTH1 family peptidyl-tRNA hydrolase
MNSSGKVIPALLKQGIKAENILVVHDELEQPFGAVRIKVGGSAKGHNGLKSIIAACGDQFARLQFGIGRPTFKEDVPNYVLAKFNENPEDLEHLIEKAISLLQNYL